MNTEIEILLVEDNPRDADMTLRALIEASLDPLVTISPESNLP